MHKANRLLLVLATTFPLLAVAQAATPPGIVAPPVPPGVTAPVAKAPVPTVTPAPAAVAAPTPVASAVAPAAPAGLVDIAIPAPPQEPKGELKPTGPASTPKKQKAEVKHATDSKRDEEKKVSAKAVVDPFAGIMGTPVSDSQLNRFVFTEAVDYLFFPEGTPLPECPKDAAAMDPCKPVFLNGRKVVLLQLRAGAKGPIQMLVNMQSGRFTTLNLMPAPGPGAVVREDGAEDGVSDSRLAAKAPLKTSEGMAASEQQVDLLKRFARGDIPAGFEAIPVARATRFELFDVVPMATWGNGTGLKAHLMQVRAHGSQPVAINSALFRSERVRALALDRETITDKAPALLYLLEFAPEGM